MKKINKNVKISFFFKSFYGLSLGIYLVIFNLYLVEMGIAADMIGTILSASPLAYAIGSIPIGYLTEIIGFKKSFLLIYGVSGLALILQVITTNIGFIFLAAFINGLALSGDFIANLMFLAQNSTTDDHSRIYSLSSLFFNLSISIGSLTAVIIPNILLSLNISLFIVYRLTLIISGIFLLAAIIPSLQISEDNQNQTRKIDFHPYFRGMNSFTFKQVITCLSLGISIGSLTPFMNLYFINHLGSSREFFGTISALTIIFIMIAVNIGPLLVSRWRSVTVVTTARLIFVVFLMVFIFTSTPMVGAFAYWIMIPIFQMSQPLALAFATKVTTIKYRTAVTSWINVAYWLGFAIAAPIVGFFMFRSNLRFPLFMAAVTMILAAIFNQIFFNKSERTIEKNNL